jgi:hypothetical protein
VKTAAGVSVDTWRRPTNPWSALGGPRETLLTDNQTFVGSMRLRGFALNAPVRQADFSPRVRRESRSVPYASDENSSGNAWLRRTTQKIEGRLGARPRLSITR